MGLFSYKNACRLAPGEAYSEAKDTTMLPFFKLADDLLSQPTLEGIFTRLGHWPHNPASMWLDKEGKVCSMSYEETKAKARDLAARIAPVAAPHRGTFVGFQAANSPLWGCWLWALLMNGLYPLLLSPDMSVPQRERLLKSAGATLLFCEEQGKSALPLHLLSQAALMDPQPGFTPQWADKMAFCSSGTTRQSVRVYDQASIVAQVVSARIMPATTRDIMYECKRDPVRNMAVLPFYHIFGFVAVYLWFSFFGRTLVYPADLSSESITSTARKLRVSHLFGVPMLWNRVADTLEKYAQSTKPFHRQVERLVAASQQAPEENIPKLPPRFVRMLVRKKALGNHIRFAISGGSYLPPSTQRLMNYLGYPLYNGYGLTEAGITSVELTPHLEDRIQGRVGQPLFGVEYKIDGQGDTGELLIKSPYLYNYTLEQGQLLPREGEWLATGDLACKSDKGYAIVGRIKDLIIGQSGENISPEELETLFAPLPHTRAFCILGLSDDAGREKIVLALEADGRLGPKETAALRARVDKVNGTLPPYKRVEELLVLAQPIPVTHTFKVRRQALKDIILHTPMSYLALTTGGMPILPSSEESKAAIRQLFAQALSLDPKEVTGNAHFFFDLGGDSYTFFTLITLFEEKYGITIPSSKYTSFSSVADFAALAEHPEELLGSEEEQF